MIDSLLAEKVQLGFDIATSVTIITALATWWLESRRRAKNEREVGINERARASSLAKVQSILEEFENAFSQIVLNGTKFERPIDIRLTDKGDGINFSKLALHIGKNRPFIQTQLESLRAFIEGTDHYYETIQKRRYTLLPVLDSIKDGQKIREDFFRDIEEIAQIHNRLGSGWSALLKEFVDLQNIVNETLHNQTLSTEDSIKALISNSDFKDRAFSILLDIDYFSWVSSFVPSGEEETYKDAIRNNTADQIRDTVFTTYINLASSSVTKGDELMAQILYGTSCEVQAARIECKDILIKLSALSHKLLSNKEDRPLKEIITDYEEVLGKDTLIR
ncbi:MULTISPECIES: hypothetical protein [Shewanella]|uniref:hypothetical protein n=1 Tax=Shewanella TaxID=22 RepID=UPI001C661F5E|nr:MULTISPECIES: hypothetical protein [Shewanella]QYJ74980.1 hypothetical protein K0H79_16805 [Shewanella sp. FJAT-52076]QYK04853.1 hypothetical protein K0H63_17665 [Shewanella zhangzhouensis]